MTTPAQPLQPRPYQERLITETSQALRHVSSVLAVMPTGAGKCCAPETPLLHHDGRVAAHGDIQPGDCLLGPDGRPRRVQSVSRGHGPMYRIQPQHGGDAWLCNDAHVLTLTNVASNAGRLSDVPLSEYLAWPEPDQQTHHLVRPAVDFPDPGTLPLPPYFVGIFAIGGYASPNAVDVSAAHPKVAAFCRQLARDLGLDLAKHPTTPAPHRYVFQPERPSTPNPLHDTLTALGLLGVCIDERRLPLQYCTASRRHRRELLHGVIDAYTITARDHVSLVNPSAQMVQDIAYVARSLGLTAQVHQTHSEPHRTDGSYRYHTVTIDNATAPCDDATPPAPTPFTVTPVGDGPYCGFTLDGDGRYLLGDFTVTHNTVTFAEITRRSIANGKRVSIIVHRQELIQQSAKAITRQTGRDPGIVWSHLRQWDNPITIISHGTIQLAKPPAGFQPDVLILDEAHHATAEGWQAAITTLDPRVLLGFTATPFRQDREPLYPKPFSKIIRPITPQELIDLGVLCPAVIESPIVTDAATGLPLPPNRAANLPSVYLKAVHHALARGKTKIILFVSGTQDRTPLQVIDDTCALLNARGIPAGAIRDGMNAVERNHVVARFQSTPSASVICNYMALTEGFDAPEVDCVVVGRTTQSESTIIQMIGRGLRHYPSKEDCLVINYTGRTDMEDIIHYWRIDEPKTPQPPALRDHPLRTRKELSQLSTQFTLDLNPINQDQAVYPWFKPATKRPLMALSVPAANGVTDAYVTIEPQRDGSWNTASVSLLPSGPSPVSISRQNGLTAAQAAAYVKSALGPQAPSIKRSANWRQKPASDSQLKTYESLTNAPPPDTITAGEASDVIAVERFRRRQLDQVV